MADRAARQQARLETVPPPPPHPTGSFHLEGRTIRGGQGHFGAQGAASHRNPRRFGQSFRKIVYVVGGARGKLTTTGRPAADLRAHPYRRQRDCHCPGIPSPPILKYLLQGEDGAAEWQSRQEAHRHREARRRRTEGCRPARLTHAVGAWTRVTEARRTCASTERVLTQCLRPNAGGFIYRVPGLGRGVPPILRLGVLRLDPGVDRAEGGDGQGGGPWPWQATGEPRRTAAIPMENHYCSCKLSAPRPWQAAGELTAARAQRRRST